MAGNRRIFRVIGPRSLQGRACGFGFGGNLRSRKYPGKRLKRLKRGDRGLVQAGNSGRSWPTSLNWQQPNPVPAGIDRNQGALLELLLACIQGAHHDRAHGRRENVLRPDLNHAGLAGFTVCEEGAKIEIMSEDDESMSRSVIHDDAVRCGWVSDF